MLVQVCCGSLLACTENVRVCMQICTYKCATKQKSAESGVLKWPGATTQSCEWKTCENSNGQVKFLLQMLLPGVEKVTQSAAAKPYREGKCLHHVQLLLQLSQQAKQSLS